MKHRLKLWIATLLAVVSGCTMSIFASFAGVYVAKIVPYDFMTIAKADSVARSIGLAVQVMSVAALEILSRQPQKGTLPYAFLRSGVAAASVMTIIISVESVLLAVLYTLAWRMAF